MNVYHETPHTGLYDVNPYHYERAYQYQCLNAEGEVLWQQDTYHDTLKDAYLDAVDYLDHAPSVALLVVVHKGSEVARLTGSGGSTAAYRHEDGVVGGWVARYAIGSSERAQRAAYSSKYVVTLNK